jgi:hypothetical protein
VKTFRVLKETPFRKFKKQVAAELGIPVQFQRYWQWVERGKTAHTGLPALFCRRRTP